MELENLNTLKGLIAKAYRVMGKKLTTKDRKKLKESTFCGPNRSFPVPDCKHVAVAKAYLGKAKFSAATKKKIAACINAKAKKLGCSVTKKAKAGQEDSYFPKYIELSYVEKQLYMSDVFMSTRELVETSLKSPDIELKFIDIIA